MGLIRKQLKVAGGQGERECEVLFDTGATACFVREDVAEELADFVPLLTPVTFTLGDKSAIAAERATVLFATLDGHPLFHTFLVVPWLPVEVIVGVDFLQRWKIGLDPATEEFIIDEKALEHLLV